MNFILELGTMCTDVEIDEEKKEFLGDPTEVAICKMRLTHAETLPITYYPNDLS